MSNGSRFSKFTFETSVRKEQAVPCISLQNGLVKPKHAGVHYCNLMLKVLINQLLKIILSFIHFCKL